MKPTWQQALADAFSKALADSIDAGATEKESYEEAMSLASGWEMRLEEIEAEEADE